MEKRPVKQYDLLEIPQIEGKYGAYTDGWHDGKLNLGRGKQLYRVVTIMRAKPPHRNHVAMLEALCQKAEHVTINIGSSNKLGNKNPFYPHETEEMMRLALEGKYDNFDIKYMPDFEDRVKGDGTGDKEWTRYFLRQNPDFTEIVCNNDWVLGCLEPQRWSKPGGPPKFDYVSPDQVLPQKDMLYDKGEYISATVVRTRMVNDGDWESCVVPGVAKYIKEHDLVARVKELCKDGA